MIDEKKIVSNEFLTINDLSKFFQVSLATIYRWREDGLPYVKIGRLARYNIQDVQKWIDEKNTFIAVRSKNNG